MSGDSRGNPVAVAFPLGKSIVVSTDGLNIPMPPSVAPRAASGGAPLNGMAQSLLGLAEVAKARGDLAAAEDYYRRALAIFEKLNAGTGLAVAQGT